MTILRIYVKGDGRWSGDKVGWEVWSTHPNWTLERAQKSAARLDKASPASWCYRVSPFHGVWNGAV